MRLGLPSPDPGGRGQLDPGWNLTIEGEAIEDDRLSLEVSDVELEAARQHTLQLHSLRA